MHISSYHRLIGVLRMYSDVFPLVDKVRVELTSRGGFMPAFPNATYPYKAWHEVSKGSRRTSWFFNTAPGVPHVAATYLLHISAWSK